MKALRHLALIVVVLVLASKVAAAAQSSDPPQSAPTTETTAPSKDEEAGAWSFSASATTYVLPDEGNYVQPTFTADRGWLHLEARFNYENLETGSVWAGYNFSGGEKVEWEITPMVGGVFGETKGIAPGYKASLSWKKLELYSEGEYLFDTESTSDSFFYNWSEVTLAPKEWFRFGLVTQRTRAYASDRTIERGLLSGFSIRNVDLTGHLLFSRDSKPTFIFSAGVTFP